MNRTRTGAYALLGVLTIAACSDAAGPTDTLNGQITEDVALMAADAALEDLTQMTFEVGAPAPPALMAAAPPTTRSRVVTFYDAEGVQQDAYNRLTTESIRIEVEVSGAVERDRWTASVERERELVVSGLTGEENQRIWNGDGASTLTGSQHGDSAEARSYTMTATSEIDSVVVGLPRDQNPWPLSGTITRVVRVTVVNGPDGNTVRERTVVVTFNGTQNVTMTVDGEAYEIDLAARAGDRPHRRR